jgi:hypothetical protein
MEQNVILNLNLQPFPLNLHAEFHRSVFSLGERIGVEALNFVPIWTPYEASFKKEETTINIMIKSLITEKIVLKDNERDGLLRGFKNNIKAYRDDLDAEKRVPANMLWERITNMGNIGRLSLDKETSAVISLLRDFEAPEFAQAIDTLNLRNWYDTLKVENQNLHDLLMERYNEKAIKSALKTKAAKNETDKFLKALTMYIEVQYIIGNVSTELKEFVAELNAIIKRYKDIRAQEFGRRNAKVNANKIMPNENNNQNLETQKTEKKIEVQKTGEGKFEITSTTTTLSDKTSTPPASATNKANDGDIQTTEIPAKK